MPLYEYACKKCGKHVDKIEKFDGPHLRKCPSCGGSVERMPSAPAIQFKGSGWYVNDYGRSSGKNSGSQESSSKDSSGKDFGSKESGDKNSNAKDSGKGDSGGSDKSEKQSESKSSGSSAEKKKSGAKEK